jgi:hypothetical protein
MTEAARAYISNSIPLCLCIIDAWRQTPITRFNLFEGTRPAAAWYFLISLFFLALVER